LTNGVTSQPGQAGRPTSDAPTPGLGTERGFASPGSTPPGSTLPFDHRDLLAESPPRVGQRRIGPLLAVAAITIVAVAGAAAVLLNRGDETGTTSTADQATVDPAAGDTAAGGTTTGDADDPATDDGATGTTTGEADDATGSTADSTASTATTSSTTASTTTTPTTADTTTTAVEEAGLAATIGNVTVDGDAYAVAFTTTFDPVISGDPSTPHLHFFFDTVGIDNAGVPGAGPWAIYDGPSPFRGYGPGDRPSGATKLCVTVATSGHAVDDPSVFHCADLP